MTQYGVSGAIWQQVLDVCARFSEVERVILYGSRARGDDSTGSDIDLAIDAPGMSSQIFALLWNELDDLPIIFPMDVVHVQGLKNKQLLQAIQREGVVLA
jgi:predicted nucleotidyltransferase